MAVTELIFIRVVPACQFLEINVTLEFTKTKQMVWSQMDGQGLSPHEALIFFKFILVRALEKEILEANEINFQIYA
jgi:hypothetical protein